MLAARATARRAARLSRAFATAIESAGVKVATADYGQPTSSVTFLVKAGSRYEPKTGVANILKNFAFKNTANRTALGTVREAELYGGVLSSALGREYLALTAEFLRGDEAYFVDVLSSVITSTKFSTWELSESVLPVASEETHAATVDPATRAIELAHALAFRNGLGASLFAPSHPSVSAEDVKAYASQVFGKGNIAVLGTGIDQTTLSKLVEKNLSSIKDIPSPQSTSTKAFGGETRQGLETGPQTVFIGFGVSGAPSAELSALASYLSPKPAVKWSQGTSPISPVPEGASVQTVYLPYSDASLFGVLIQGETTGNVSEAARTVAKALKGISSVKSEEVKKSVAKAKFAAASAVEDSYGFVTSFGPKILAGSPVALENAFEAYDKVTESTFSKVAATLLKSPSSYVVVGDTNKLPYKDELGL